MCALIYIFSVCCLHHINNMCTCIYQGFTFAFILHISAKVNIMYHMNALRYSWFFGFTQCIIMHFRSKTWSKHGKAHGWFCFDFVHIRKSLCITPYFWFHTKYHYVSDQSVELSKWSFQIQNLSQIWEAVFLFLLLYTRLPRTSHALPIPSPCLIKSCTPHSHPFLEDINTASR